MLSSTGQKDIEWHDDFEERYKKPNAFARILTVNHAIDIIFYQLYWPAESWKPDRFLIRTTAMMTIKTADDPPMMMARLDGNGSSVVPVPVVVLPIVVVKLDTSFPSIRISKT